MKFNVKNMGFKKTSIIILTMLIPTLLNLNVMNSFAENSNVAEEIKKAEENIIWTDIRYNIYSSLDETVIGVLFD